MRDRQDVRITLRLVSVLLVAAAFGVVAFGPAIMVFTRLDYYAGYWSMFLQAIGRHVYQEELPRAVCLVFVAVLLWLLQKPLARLIAPSAGAACPECGYSLHGIKAARCPECGAEIGTRISR